MDDSIIAATGEYLGDAVYAKYDGEYIWLYTSNGIEIANEIGLEPAVIKKLLDYIERVTKGDENG